jgi:hypothetical protein
MTIRVRLTRKFAQRINGIDLSRVRTGEELDLPAREAQLLIAEGWAAPIDDDSAPSGDRRRPKRK